MSGLDSQRPFCKACGLHAPCPACSKVKLSVVSAERTFSRDEIRAALKVTDRWIGEWIGRELDFEDLEAALYGEPDPKGRGRSA